ncbi:hypothetical protein J5N97_000632 [Dioscorea zingiberensis]|uniref:Uncharacterized protein n=1 Tax=Dioscorea zingiberensis TaxID=325984 RepID=A0A9D5BUZ7_9LILI|nr:hypothetical protein J5N97_000632 [Dioscorea zingiberensis]
MRARPVDDGQNVEHSRRDISLSIKQPHNPPPLCSVCKRKGRPCSGKPPRKFSYEEMAKATSRFSSRNSTCLKGVRARCTGECWRTELEWWPVKKHRKVSAQGRPSSAPEVEFSSCAAATLSCLWGVAWTTTGSLSSRQKLIEKDSKSPPVHFAALAWRYTADDLWCKVLVKYPQRTLTAHL